MSGSTFAASRTPSWAAKASTTSRTAVALPMSNNDTPWTIRSSLPAMGGFAGESRRVMAPGPSREAWVASSAGSSPIGTRRPVRARRRYDRSVGGGGLVAVRARDSATCDRPLPSRDQVDRFQPYGFKATFNPTYPARSGQPFGWVSPWHFGLSQGPIVLMIENYRTGLLWN